MGNFLTHPITFRLHFQPPDIPMELNYGKLRYGEKLVFWSQKAIALTHLG